MLTPEQRRQLNEEIASRQHKVEQMLGSLTTRKLSEAEKNSVERIKSFLNLSHQTLERGDTQHGHEQEAPSLLASCRPQDTCCHYENLLRRLL